MMGHTSYTKKPKIVKVLVTGHYGSSVVPIPTTSDLVSRRFQL